MPVTRLERPDDLTAEWLTAAIGAGTVDRFSHRADRHRPDERVLPGRLDLCRRRRRGPGSVVLKVAASDPSEPADRAGARSLRARGALLHRGRVRASAVPSRRATTRRIDTRNGRVPPAARGCRPGRRRRRDPRRHNRTGDAGDGRAGPAARAAARRRRAGRRGVAQPRIADEPGADRAAATPGSWSATATGSLRRIARCASGSSPVSTHTAPRSAARTVSRAGARRLPAGQHAVRRGRRRPAAHRGRLADRHLGAGDRPMSRTSSAARCPIDDPPRATTTRCCARTTTPWGRMPRVGLEDVREGVRRQSFFGVMMAIVSLDARRAHRARRRDVHGRCLRRHSQHVLDTDALAILPEPAAAEALQPVRRRRRRAPSPVRSRCGARAGISTSSTRGRGFGGWFRLGLIPNQHVAWVTRAGLRARTCPTVAVIDFEAPLPDDLGVVGHRRHRARPTPPPSRCSTYRVGLRGRGQAYDDPSALLRGEPGRPVDLSMDLTWTTAGTPYQYRLTPRYEIPCTVSGTVVADGRTVAVDGVPGQRDHSWGVRDWWSMDWVWSAAAPRRRHPSARRRPADPRITRRSASATSSRRPARWSSCRRCRHGKRSATTAYRGRHHAGAEARRCDRHGRDRGPRTGAAHRRRRPGEPVSARVGDRHHRADGRTGVGWLEWNRNPH